MYGIGSLTKSFTAACPGSPFPTSDRKDWSTPIEEIIPEYMPKAALLQGLVSTTDFLSHRTSLWPDMSEALQGELEFLLAPDDLLPTVSDLPSVDKLRHEWMYNNWGYSMAGLAIEKLSGKPFHEYLQEAILDTLQLTNTTTRPRIGENTDIAEPYAALKNGTAHLLPMRFPFAASIFEAAGGLYSSVNDLLQYAKAVLQSEKDPEQGHLKNIRTLLSNQIALDSMSPKYGFYDMGWVGVELPSVVGLQGDNAGLFKWEDLPVIGDPARPTRTYYHQGAAIGYYSAIFIFPETESAVVVLTNSMPLNDAADWLAQLYISALFDFPEKGDYVNLAAESMRRKVKNVAKLRLTYDKLRLENPKKARPLNDYIGRYYNSPKSFFIDVRLHETEPYGLRIAFQGLDSQIYELRHLHGDTFEWAPDYDESARRARFTIWDPTYFEIDFAFCEDKPRATSLQWVKSADFLPQGTKLVREEVNGSSHISFEDMREEQVVLGFSA